MKKRKNISRSSQIIKLIEKGISLNESGKYSEAITYFDRVLSLDTENMTAMVDKGFSLEKLKKYDEAINCYDKALTIDPNNLEALQNKGYIYLLTMNFNQAFGCFERVLAIDNNFILAVHGLFSASLAMSNFNTANAASKQLMANLQEIDPYHAFLLIDYYFKEKDYLQLMELFCYLIFGCQIDQIVFSAGEAIYPDKVRKLLAGLAFIADSSLMFNRLAIMGNIKQRTGRFDCTWLDPLLKAFLFSEDDHNLMELEKQANDRIDTISRPFHPNINVRDKPNDKLEDPELLQKRSSIRQRFNKAWEVFYELACRFYTFYSAEANSFMLQGISYGEQENYIKAIDSFKQALTINPYHYDSFGNLGVVLRRYGFTNLAILCYQESLRIHYLNDVCHHNLGLAFLDVKRFDEAIFHFEESQLLGGSIENSSLEYAMRKKERGNIEVIEYNNANHSYDDLMAMGLDYINGGEWNQAIKFLEIAISISPVKLEPYIKLGFLYQHIGKHCSAAKAFERFLETSSLTKGEVNETDLASAYQGLGLSYGHMGISSNDTSYIDKAIEMFSKSIQNDPSRPRSYHLLGGLYLRKRNYERAIENLLKAIELSPDLDEAFGELGQAYYEAGQLENAVKAFECALRINPNNPIHLNNLNVIKAIRLPTQSA